MHCDESALIQRSKNGDRHAFEQLYRANAAKINGLCLRLCGQKELAEDLTQESFIRAWQKLSSFRGDSAFSSWMYRLASNVAIGHLRQQTKWNMVSFETDTHEKSLGFSNIDVSRNDIEKLLRTLPDQARIVVILHEYLGYKHTEISKLTGIAIGTSKSHLHRARELMKPKNAVA